jgi:Zn-dependent protease with chaperone function
MPLNALSDPYLRFRGMVSRLEADANDRPRAYRLRVIALAIVGYGFVFLMLALGLFLLSWVVGRFGVRGTNHGLSFPAVLAGISLVYGSLRALWVTIEPVDGLKVERTQAPELFRLIDKVRQKTRGPAVHRVLIDNQMNAGISQRPRLGVLGFYENTLTIGLPYAMTVDARCFAGMLAHEYGHLSGAHGKWSAWIYRMRRSWAAIGDRIEESGGYFGLVYALPFRLYWPFFNAYSFVLARRQEYEADKTSQDLVGAASAANALVSAHIAAQYLDDEFWPAVYKGAETSQSVNRNPFREMQTLLKTLGRHPGAKEWMSIALARVSDVDDTHPPLRDRLDALHQTAALPPIVTRSAAESLLGDSLDGLITHFDREWRNEIKPWWKDRYAETQASRARLAKLSSMMDQKQANVDEQLEHAYLLERFDSWQKAAAAYEAALQRTGNEPRAHFALGRLLVQNKDDRGFASLRRAAELSEDFVIPAARVAIQPLEMQGRFREANEFRANADRAYQDYQDLMRLAWEFEKGDSYRPHGLRPDDFAHVDSVVRRERGIATAYLARKYVSEYPDRVVLVLAIELESRLTDAGAVTESINSRLSLPYPVLVVALGGADDSGARESIEQVRGSRIF